MFQKMPLTASLPFKPNGSNADKAGFLRNCTNVGFGGGIQHTVVFGVILPAYE
jgi:hypothetical protein